MKDDVFAELIASAQEALDHARGKRELRTTTLPEPPAPMSWSDVKRLRARLQASQAVFAHYLNVSTKLVQAWEGRRREPEGAALRLLRLAEEYPSVVFREAMVSESPRTPRVKQVSASARPVSAARTAKAGRSAGRAKKARRRPSTVVKKAG
jgi:putative transcriptional regulator